MKRTLVILTVVLLVQLGLGVAFFVAGQQPATAKGGAALLTFSPDQVDELIVVGPQGEQVALKKTAAGWILPEHFSAAADSAKVEALLQELCGLKRPWPVAQTAASDKRFKVSAEDFDRKLVFSAGGKQLTELLIGSSPGFRKVHARLASEEQVYDIPFSAYQAGLKVGEWLNRDVLQLPKNKISGLELADLKLVRKDGAWQLDPAPENGKTDPQQAAQLVDLLANLKIKDVAGQADPNRHDQAALQLSLQLDGGQDRHYAFFTSGDAKAATALLQVDGFDRQFQVDTDIIGKLKAFDRQHLVLKSAAPAHEQAASPSAEDTMK